MDIHKFGEILVQKSKERLKQNNNDEVKSGLFEYYNTYYLKNKNFYFPCELSILKYVNNNYNKKCKILEIACGCGQISLALRKVFNFTNVYSNDKDKRRIHYGEFLNQNIEPQKKVTFLTKDYRDMNINLYDLIIITNISHDKIGITNKEYKQFMDFLKNKKDIIFIPNYYGSRGTNNLFIKNYKNNKSINVEKIWNCDNTQCKLSEKWSIPFDVEKVSLKKQ